MNVQEVAAQYGEYLIEKRRYFVSILKSAPRNITPARQSKRRWTR